MHNEQNTVSLTVGADPTIQLWCENQNVAATLGCGVSVTLGCGPVLELNIWIGPTGSTLPRLTTIHTEIHVTNCNYLVTITNQYIQRFWKQLDDGMCGARRDSVQLETAINTISHEYLLDFTSEYGIPETLHPELPGPGDRIVDFPEGKVGVYTSKRPGKNTPQCYTKPLVSLKNWNNRFFWVDERVFPTVVEWRTNASKDGMPANGTYSVEDVRALDTHRTTIQKQPEMLLCMVGISRIYYLGKRCTRPSIMTMTGVEMDIFSLIRATNPTKVKTGSRPRALHEVPLLTLTATRVIEMDEPAASGRGTAAPEMPPPEDVPATAARGADQAGEASRKRGHDGTDANAPPKSLRRDHADLRPS
nr:transposase (putative), gypsy type [Tanacetum cinerariifolium]